MYQHILIPVENSKTDQTILAHVRELARLHGSRLRLLHVADGWAARHYRELRLQESDEIRGDRQYLADLHAELTAEGFEVATELAMGDPATEILRVAREQKVDLIAMGTHGHRGVADIIYGSTADKVRHLVDIPVLLLKGKR